jgi:hypothetical protein
MSPVPSLAERLPARAELRQLPTVSMIATIHRDRANGTAEHRRFQTA